MKKTKYTAGGLPVYQAEGGDYPAVSAFLNDCRSALDRAEFFYPYTDEELKSVLEGGVFLCAVSDGEIAGTFALDTDKSYGKLLAGRVKECTCGRIAPDYAYETSGLMVAEKYRRRGMAGQLTDAIIDTAQHIVPADFLCGVVQAENVASMSAFLSRGFVLAAVYSMGGEYDFCYFVRPARSPFTVKGGEEELVPFRDMPAHLNALARGKVGVRIEGECMIYVR